MACHAKAHLSEVGKFVARESTEVHGGMGITDLLGLHYWFKRIGFNRQLLRAPELVREEAARVQEWVWRTLRLDTNPQQLGSRSVYVDARIFTDHRHLPISTT